MVNLSPKSRRNKVKVIMFCRAQNRLENSKVTFHCYWLYMLLLLKALNKQGSLHPHFRRYARHAIWNPSYLNISTWHEVGRQNLYVMYVCTFQRYNLRRYLTILTKFEVNIPKSLILKLYVGKYTCKIIFDIALRFDDIFLFIYLFPCKIRYFLFI